MISRLVFLVALGVPALVGAQSIDPSQVPDGTKITWCDAQLSSCPILCSQTSSEPVEPPLENSCDDVTLAYECVCADGLRPNATEYSQTIPYFICSEANDRCVARCQGNSACQSACREDHPCGATNPTRVNTSTASTMSATATSSESGDVIYTGFAGSTPTTASRSGGTSAGRTAVDLGSSYGLGMVAAGIFAGFALFL